MTGQIFRTIAVSCAILVTAIGCSNNGTTTSLHTISTSNNVTSIRPYHMEVADLVVQAPPPSRVVAPKKVIPKKKIVVVPAKKKVVAKPVIVRDRAAVFACIRQRESHNNYSTNTGNRQYGAYQFLLSTWRSVGGKGLPSNATPAEQDLRADILQRRYGWGQWSTHRFCGV